MKELSILKLLKVTLNLAKINDTLLKWIGIPIIGILVFQFSGFHKKGYTLDFLLINYFAFFFISFCVWNGNSFSQFLLRKKIQQIKKVYLKILVRFCITIIISFFISYILLLTWNFYIHNNSFTNNELFFSEILITFISIQIGSVYEIIYLHKERESDLIKIERSEKLKVQAQLDALKSQIDPHFIFNSLNTLSYLIKNDPQKASTFNDTLAKVYRYILMNKEKDTVLLKEEIEFSSNFFFLIKIRYQSGLNLQININDIALEQYLIPPLSLQSLIENAIKHNHFSEAKPLNIQIIVSNAEIIVSNNVNQKKFELLSSKIGLLNLNERYKLTINKSIEILQTPFDFTVKLPTLKK